ncbi:MAG: glycerophosphodiester phosphodiesterase [Pygmaiobacter sp.]
MLFFTFILPLLLIALLLFALVAFLTQPRIPDVAKSAPFYGRNYAHRGLHTRDKSVPENSLAAFRAAVEAGYGIELDIQLSRDGKVVVFHDDDLLRVCGINGRVDDYTLAELQRFSLCGTAERIPLLSEVFEVMGGKTPMIIELKSGPNNNTLCETALPLMRAYRGAFCIESFDPRIVRWFKQNAPDLLRGQLADAPKQYTTMPRIAGFALGNLLSNFLCRPEFIAYNNIAKPFCVRRVDKLGSLKVLWTARDEADAARVEAENDLVIFEFYRPAVFYKDLPLAAR